MTYRVKNITIAVALALVAALLTSFYVTNYQRNVRQDETNVPIWVAKRDIPAGTTGADIERKGMLEKSEIVRRSVVPGAISNPDQVAELVTSQPIYAGEQVSTRRFSTPSQRGIKAQLTGVQRAIEIPGDQHQLLAGTLKDGDKVDLVATFGAGGATGVARSRGSSSATSRCSARRRPATRSAEDHVRLGRDGGFAVMLKVTDTQVQKLHWVYTAAEEWHLELRPGMDAADSPENVESWYSVLREGVRQKQLDDAGADSIPAVGGGNAMNNESIRIYVTGSCDGLDNLREELANHPGPRLRRLERERRRGDDRPRRRPPPGRRPRHPLDVVPRRRGRRDPRAHALADRDHRLGRVVGPARGGARRRGRRRRPAAAAADRERRLRAPQGGARRPPARRRGRPRPPRADHHRVLAEGRHGQDRHRDEPRRLVRQARAEADAPARPRPAVRRRRDHARDRAREDDLRPGRRPGRARLGEARGLHRPSTRAGSTSCRRRCARRTPSS